MFKDHKFALIILAIILASALLLRILGSKGDDKKEDKPKIEIPQTVVQAPIDLKPTSTVQVVEKTQPQIVKPQVNGLLISPYEVSGLAPGSWFFEASLPVKLLDDQGQEIVAVPAQALSDWMTSDLVPFTANLNFSTQATSGYVVIKKDNPSGLPEYDDELRIPIRFK